MVVDNVFTPGEILTAEELNNLRYVLPPAKVGVLGGIMPGDNCTVDANGRLNVTATSTSSTNDSTYVLPVTTIAQLGGMIVGDNLVADETGRVSAIIPTYTPPEPYVLPAATTTTLGGIIAGDNVTVDANGRLSAVIPASTYTLPPCSTTTLGGMIVGDNLTVDPVTGRVSAPAPVGYTLPQADDVTLGGIKFGTGFSFDAATGKTSVVAGSYTLPVATTQTLGGIKAGAGATIAADGTLTVSATGGLGNVTFSDYVTTRGRAKPPAPQTGYVRTIKDQLTSQMVNTADFFDHSVYSDSSVKLNQILKYCQDIAHISMSNAFYGFTAGSFITCFTPMGEIVIRDQTVVVPGNVEWDCRARVIRTNTGAMSWLRKPAVIVTPFAHIRNLTLVCHIANVRGNGLVIGPSFLATAYKKTASGRGYTAGQTLVLSRFSATRTNEGVFKNTHIRVDTVDSVGAILTWTVTKFGSYDVAVEAMSDQGVFSDPNISGTGARFQVTAYQGPFEGSRIRRGPGGIYCQTITTDVNVIEAGDDLTFSSTEGGYMFAICYTGLNHEIHRVYAKGGRDGIRFQNGADVRINNLNTVLSGTAVRVSGFGAITCSNFALDSSYWASMELSGTSGQYWNGRIFWESAANDDPFLADGVTANVYGRPHNSGYAVIIGDTGSTGQLISGLNINLQCTNVGGYNKAQPVAFIDRVSKSEINLQATNAEYSGYQEDTSKKISTLYHFSTGTGLLQSDSRFSGSLALVSGPMYTGDPKDNDLDIFDAHVGGVCGPRGFYTITGNYVPTNGTSGTGARKAETGSEFRKVGGSAPYRYINTGTKASPVWTPWNIN